MFRKRFLAVAACLLLLDVVSSAKSNTATVAVVVDPATYEYAKSEVDSYVSSISSTGRKGLLLIDKWGVPDSLRAEFIRLHKQAALEGVVLVGDIPVPMIRDGQHLCSAFKMDQRYPWMRSSVPSDRYYDDFGLQFKFLKQEPTRKDIFYYSLLAEGDQKIYCDIFSSRIRPAETPLKHEQIKQYLRKAVAARNEQNELDNALFYAGHGYNSESMNARIDENHVLLQQLPGTETVGGSLKFINHTFDEAVKYRLLATLAADDLDLAILHHHGAPDTQYMNGSPYVSSPDGWLRLAKNYFRGKMSSAKNKEAAKQDFMKRYGVPAEWLDEYTDPKLMAQDSLYAESLDLTIPDLQKAHCGARMVIFDACYNGAFIEKDYIAANYLFNEGNRAVVARAHSVNTLQDKWETELIGLMGRGICAGNWARLDMDLDTHLFGDPLFCFGTRSSLDLQMAGAPAKFWAKMLKSEDSELRTLAVLKLAGAGAIPAEKLLTIQQTDPSRTVRLEAMLCQIDGNSPTMVEAITAGMADNYELTQRLACKYGARNLDPSLTEAAVRLYANPSTSKRVLFQCKNIVTNSDIQAVKAAFEKYPMWDGSTADILKGMERSAKADAEEISNLQGGAKDAKSAKFFIRKQRNNCCTNVVEPMLECYAKTTDATVKSSIAETFGWYCSSCKREYIRAKCEELLASETDPELQAELRKTIKRLQ